MSVDNKTSILINRQLPEFVREEHPKFISFLEAYYEFLEQKQGSEKNDLTTKSKELRYISDVDESLDEFEENFYSTYMSLIPRDVVVDKAFLIKNVLPIYLSKGSEKAFKLLFRLLFGSEASLSYPKNNILRASDGKWSIENILRVSNNIKTYSTGNGINRVFKLSQVVDESEITVHIDDIKQNSGYHLRIELKELVFDTAPSNNSIVSVSYSNFDIEKLVNRQITGEISGTKTIVEKVGKKSSYGEQYFQLFFNKKTLDGSFRNGESCILNYTDTENEIINVRINTLSDVNIINVINGGANYNVGDPVIIRGQSTRQATAIVGSVAQGAVERIQVIDGASGFKLYANVVAEGIANSVFDARVSSIDTREITSSNTVNVYTELISNVDYANVLLSAVDFGLPVGNANINSVIANSLSNTTLSNLGTITSVEILTNTITTNPPFDVYGPTILEGSRTIHLGECGIIGKINIVSNGVNYSIGDELIFNAQPGVFWGYGANARVSNVSATGAITGIKIYHGGFGYVSGEYPSISVSSANGSNAILEVNSVLGDDEILQGILSKYYPGQILNIKVIDSGSGYVTIPNIDLSNFGNGLATANAQLQSSVQELKGKWLTSDSIISDDATRIEGRDYYINFSYVISSKVEFSQYKSIMKQLIHPTGFVSYAEYMIDENIILQNSSIKKDSIKKELTGTVNVNNTIYVVGTNTKFNIANVNGILTVGSNVAVNNQIRTVNAIVSNTLFTVSQAFSFSSNNESIVIVI